MALDQTFSAGRSFDAAMGDYQRERDDKVLAMYEFTWQLATLAPPPPETQQLFGAISGQSEGHGWLRPDERGDHLAGGVFLAGEYQRDHVRTRLLNGQPWLGFSLAPRHIMVTRECRFLASQSLIFIDLRTSAVGLTGHSNRRLGTGNSDPEETLLRLSRYRTG